MRFPSSALPPTRIEVIYSFTPSIFPVYRLCADGRENKKKTSFGFAELLAVVSLSSGASRHVVHSLHACASVIKSASFGTDQSRDDASQPGVEVTVYVSQAQDLLKGREHPPTLPWEFCTFSVELRGHCGLM